MNKEQSIVQYMQGDAVAENIKNALGERSQEFITSVASLVNANEALQKCDRASVLSACLVSATLNLPVNQNLGFAYIIPYGGKAQLQIGYKGFIQLAMRSGQVDTMNVTDVKEGELLENDLLTGKMKFEWKENRESLPTVGYVAYLRLTNGFDKTLYMTRSELEQHAGKYSQSYKKGGGMNLWRDDFDTMAKKTVLKLLLSKHAPLSTNLQRAQEVDQAIVLEDGTYDYVDNPRLDLPEPVNNTDSEEVTKTVDDVMSKIKEDA